MEGRFNMFEIVHPVIEPTFFCAYPDDESFLHYGKLMSINAVGTGQPNLVAYTDHYDWMARCAEFGVIIDPDTDMEVLPETP